MTEETQTKATVPDWFISQWARCIVRVRYATTFGTQRSHRRVKRDHWSFFVVSAGTLRLQCFTYDLLVPQGHMVLLPPYRHAHHGPAETYQEVAATEVGFDIVPLLEGGNPLMQLPLPLSLSPNNRDDVRNYCMRLEQCFEAHPRQPRALLWSQHWFGLLLATYIEHGFTGGHFEPLRAGPIPDWVQKLELAVSTKGNNITIKEIHGLSGFSRAYVDAAFRKHFGTTPHQYWHRCRIELAMEWLTSHPEMSIAEIAAECGYSTQSLFNRHFRRLTGQTPGHFRRQRNTTH